MTRNQSFLETLGLSDLRGPQHEQTSSRPPKAKRQKTAGGGSGGGAGGGDGEGGEVGTRRSWRDTRVDPPGAAQIRLKCPTCQYETHLKGPIAAQKELSLHLVSSVCKKVAAQGEECIQVAPRVLRAERSRLERVALAEAAGQQLLNCCQACPWRDVVDISKEASNVMGAHRKQCVWYLSRHHRVSRTDDHDDSAAGGEEFEDDPVTRPLVIATEEHENFVVNVVLPSNGKTASEKRAHMERLQAYDTSLPSRLTRVETEMGGAEAASSPEGLDVDSCVYDFDTDTDASEVDTFQKRQSACVRVLRHQHEVERKLRDPLPDMRGGKDPATITALYDLGMTLNLSHREGDLLLDYLGKHGNGTFYKSWEGIQAAFDRQFKDICVLNRLEIELPVEFFGSTEKGGTPLKKTVCEYYDVLLRIGDAFLEINPDDFAKSFSIPDLVKGTAERIYSTFPKAKLFRRFVAWTKSTHGDEAVPVVIAVYFDEAEATSSRAACPLIMFILNCTGDSFKPIFLGYCPVSLPYSDEYLTKLLNSRGTQGRIPSKASCKYAIRFAKRQAMQRFLVHVLKPVVDCDQGILLQLGARRMYPPESEPEVIFAVTHLCHFIGDSAALHDYVGSVKIGCKFCRCRMCTCSNLNAFGQATEAACRDSEEMYALTSKLGEYELYKFQRSCGLLSEAERKLSKVERAKRRTIRKIGKFRGVIPGENPVILLWETLEKAGIINFFVALCIDILHTIWKGILESAAACAMQLVHCIGLHYAELDLPPKYRDAMGKLDTRLASFAGGKESLQPFPFVHLEKVSELLKEEAKQAKGQDRTTGLITGSFPAWQMRNLCLQLVFGIGWEGSLIPNSEMEFGEGRWGNPTSLCLNALLGVLRVAAYCEARELTESQLHLMHKYITNASCRLLQLYDFKQLVCLKAGYIRRSRPAKAREMPSNFKTHGMSHLPRQYRLFGEWTAYDAAAGEKYHQVVVSGAMKRSSGVIETTQQEMAVHVVRKQFVKMQAEYLPAVPRPSTEKLIDDRHEEELELEQDSRFQTFHAVLSLGSASLTYTSDDDFLAADTGEEIDFLHPLLYPCELWELVVKASEKETFIKEVMGGFARSSPDYSIRLFGAVKCDGDLAAGVKPWFLRANRHYHGNFRGKGTRQGVFLFNSFEVTYSMPLGDTNCFAKVLALVGFQRSPTRAPLEARTEIWVACARYTKRAKPRFAPFDQYEFEQERGKLSIDLVSLDSIKRPCFMCASCDAPHNRRVETRFNYSEMQWSCIPFSEFNKVLNVAMDTTSYEDESAGQDSSVASNEVIASVLADFDLGGEYNHMLTASELEILLPSSGDLESGSDSASDSPTDNDSDGASDY